MSHGVGRISRVCGGIAVLIAMAAAIVAVGAVTTRPVTQPVSAARQTLLTPHVAGRPSTGEIDKIVADPTALVIQTWAGYHDGWPTIMWSADILELSEHVAYETLSDSSQQRVQGTRILTARGAVYSPENLEDLSKRLKDTGWVGKVVAVAKPTSRPLGPNSPSTAPSVPNRSRPLRVPKKVLR